MKRAILRLASIVAGVAFSLPVTAEEFVPIIGWEKQLFPSYLISTATMTPPEPVEGEGDDSLGDRNGLLGVKVNSPGENVSIKVTITCDEIMEASSFSGMLPDEGTEYLVYPTVKYRYSKLAEINQATPVRMTFRVQIGKQQPVDQTATVLVRPINDCPFQISVGDEVLDLNEIFAAYVNEQHPFLDKLLRESLNRGVVDSFSGYQGGTDEDTIRQAYALWDALVARDVRYSSITVTSGESQSVHSQHVRMIDESLNNSQANCVDGSVLFASLLRKINIEPVLVLTNTHCYVAFYLDRSREKLVAIETTMLGSVVDSEDYDTNDLVEGSVDEDVRDESSWPSFASAVVAGTADLISNLAETEPKNGFRTIDIAAARKAGILPIAFRGKEEFTEYVTETDEEMSEESAEEEPTDEAESEESTDEDTEEESMEEEDADEE